MPQSDFRDTGAFRGASGWSSKIEYRRCDECQRIYEMNIQVRGLAGSINRSSGWLEEERRRREQSDRLKVLFANEIHRCVCDPSGDVEFLKEREKERRESEKRASLSPPATSGSDAANSKQNPARSNLGTTSEAVRRLPGKTQQGKKNSDLLEQLTQLTDLFNAGALSREQFEAAKNKLLDL